MHFSTLTRIQEEAQSILEFAASRINFDEAQMQDLRTAVQSADIQLIMRAIQQAKESAAEMLEEEGYQEFCRYVREGQGMP